MPPKNIYEKFVKRIINHCIALSLTTHYNRNVDFTFTSAKVDVCEFVTWVHFMPPHTKHVSTTLL